MTCARLHVVTRWHTYGKQDRSCTPCCGVCHVTHVRCMDWGVMYTWVTGWHTSVTRPGVGSGILIIIEHTDKRRGTINRRKRYACKRGLPRTAWPQEPLVVKAGL